MMLKYSAFGRPRMRFPFRGAESVISVEGETVVKERIRKSYRIEELDTRIRKLRTRKEAKILKKLNALAFPTPKLVKTYDDTIVMERINGITLREKIEQSEDPRPLFYELGVLVSRLHLADVIHGDLTTSNFIFGDRIYVIDFGLSYISSKDEDKAVDLYVFDRAVNCAHDVRYLDDFYNGYRVDGKESVERKLQAVRLRGRKREELFA